MTDFAAQMRAVQQLQPQSADEVEALKARALAAGEEVARTAWMLNRAEAVAALLTDRMHSAGMLPPDRRLAIAEIDALSVERIGAIMYDAALAGRDLLEFASERFDDIVGTPTSTPQRAPFGLDVGQLTDAGRHITRERMSLEQASVRLAAIDPDFDVWRRGVLLNAADISPAAMLQRITARYDRIAAGDE